MNNSVFGKTMENMRKRVNVELVHTKKRLHKVCAKPNFQSFKIFNEDLVAVNLRKSSIVLNRPIYAGFCILDLAKLLMFEFHYDFVKSTYGEKASLLFTDTDSLCYEIQTGDFYQDMLTHKTLFDTSNFDKNHYLYSKTNCKVLGKMKDECGGKPIEEFIGLRPKMYSLLYDGKEKKTAKGVKKCVIEKRLKHQAYKQALFDHCSMRHSMNMTRSYGHQLFSVSVRKTTLSPYDDKRFVLDSGMHTLAHGHYKTTPFDTSM
jgi:translation initiation factor IF-1